MTEKGITVKPINLHNQQTGALAGKTNAPTIAPFGEIETDKLRLFANNPRKITYTNTKMLAKNVRAVGIKNPIKIAWCTTTNAFETLDGNRRLFVAQSNKIPKVPYQYLGELTMAECWATFLDLNALTDELKDEQEGKGVIEYVIADMKEHNYDPRNKREFDRYLRANLDDLAREHGFDKETLEKKLRAAQEFEFLPDDLRKRAYNTGKYVPRLAKKLAKLSRDDPVFVTTIILGKNVNNDAAGIASTYLRAYNEGDGLTLQEALKRTAVFRKTHEKLSTNPDSGAMYGNKNVNEAITKEAERLGLPRNVLDQYLRELAGWYGYYNSKEYKESKTDEKARDALRVKVRKYVLGY